MRGANRHDARLEKLRSVPVCSQHPGLDGRHLRFYLLQSLCMCVWTLSGEPDVLIE